MVGSRVAARRTYLLFLGAERSSRKNWGLSISSSLCSLLVFDAVNIFFCRICCNLSSKNLENRKAFIIVEKYLQVGGIKPGCFKIGNTGGMMDNLLSSKLYRAGRYGAMVWS